MSDPRDPTRLHDDPATDGELRDAIGALRDGGRDERSRAAIAAGLGSLLEDPVAPPAEGGASGASTPGSGGAGVSGATRLLLIGGGLTGALVLLGLLWSVTREPEPSAPPTVTTPTATPARPVDAPTAVPDEAPAAQTPVSEAAEPAPPHAETAPPPRAAVPDPALAAPPEPPSEIALLREARAAVTSRPRRALQLCGDHERYYPNGLLGEEREVIAVQVLVALGRHGAAQRRAAAFLRAHGSSAHRAQVEALLDQVRQENDPAAR